MGRLDGDLPKWWNMGEECGGTPRLIANTCSISEARRHRGVWIHAKAIATIAYLILFDNPLTAVLRLQNHHS